MISRLRLPAFLLLVLTACFTSLPQANAFTPPGGSITSPNNTTFTVGSVGNFTVTTSGFVVAIARPLSSPPAVLFSTLTPLPSGITLNPLTGVMSGTPVLPGVYTFTIQATSRVVAPPPAFAPNAPGGGTVTQAFTLTVNPLVESVGSTAPSYPVTVTFSVAGTVASTNVLTQGSPNLDFTDAGSDTCADTSYSVGNTCVVNVKFAPTTAGLRLGAVVLEDASGNVLATAYTGGIGSGPQVAVPGIISTVAGIGGFGYGGDNGLATAATLGAPSGIAFDGAGNMYIADAGINDIRKVAAGTGIITTIAGTGTPDYAGDDGPAINADLNAPSGVALDGAGNLYIADFSNNRIRKVVLSTGVITTYAGTGNDGYSGDNGPATSADFSEPFGVAVDVAGNLYIADLSNSVIRKVTASTGVITGIAGNHSYGYSGDGGPATSAAIGFPTAIALDAAGNVYIGDSFHNVVRKIDAVTGVISPVAGNATLGYSGDSGPATSAQLAEPFGLTVDAAGDIYIADIGNLVIREVNGATGVISTVAGNGQYTDIGVPLGDGGLATNATFNFYWGGVALDASGNLYIADYGNERVRKVTVTTGAANFPTTTNVGATDGTDGTVSVPVTNIGNADLNFTALSFASDFPAGSGGTECAVGTAVTSGNSCNLPITFAPLQGGSLSETLNLVDNAGNGTPAGTQTVSLTGTGIKLTPVETVSFSSNPLAVGNDETVTVTLAGTGATPTGTVRFVVNSTPQAPVALVGGQATLQLTAPAAGPYVITAYYSGDSSYLSSTAKKGLTVLKLSPTDTLVATPSPAVLGSLVTVTFTVPTIAGIAPTGKVKLSGASATAQTLTLTNGVATYQTSSLGVGNHALIATYSGDANYTSSRLTATAVVSKATSTTSVVSSNSPQVQKTAVTFTATATGSVAGVTPTGTMQFYIDSVLVGTKALVGGQASYTTKALLTGRHPVYAVYSGDSHYTGSTSSTITQGTL